METWKSDEARWGRKLRRLRLGAEPIGEQLARHRRATLALTGVVTTVGLIFLAIFWGFGRPDVGGVVVGVLLAPVVALAWLDQAILNARASAYLRERASKDTPPR